MKEFYIDLDKITDRGILEEISRECSSKKYIPCRYYQNRNVSHPDLAKIIGLLINDSLAVIVKEGSDDLTIVPFDTLNIYIGFEFMNL